MEPQELPATIDFDALLAPIAGDLSAGIDLREDSSLSKIYYDVRDTRKAELDNERTRQRFSLMTEKDLEYELSLLQSDPRRTPNWQLVIDKASKLLERSSKDLWVAAWLVEALVREFGIAGLRDGMRLCRLLCEQYWDNLLPRPNPDEGGWEWTLTQLSGLDTTLKGSILSMPLLNPEWLGNRAREMSLSTFDQAEQLNKLDPSTRAAKISSGQTSLNDFQTAVTQATVDDIAMTSATIDAARTELKNYYEFFRRPDCDFMPSVSSIEEGLEKFANRYCQLTKDKLASSEAFNESSSDDRSLFGDSSMMADPSAIGSLRIIGSQQGKQVLTRDDALQGLLQVADFFRRTEPHSPVSYALEQAVRWGRMPLPDLLKDLISSDEVRAEMFRRLGIQSSNEDSDGN